MNVTSDDLRNLENAIFCFENAADMQMEGLRYFKKMLLSVLADGTDPDTVVKWASSLLTEGEVNG